MTEFLQRLERTSTKFEAYEAEWHKSEAQKIVQVRQALAADTKNWAEWKRKVRDSERQQEGWDELKTRLEKLAGEIRADEITVKEAASKVNPCHAKAAAAKAIAEEKAAAAAAQGAGEGPAKGGRQRETAEERAARVALSP
jgi:hypothetical protein